MHSPWSRPVMLACKTSGQFFVISSTAEAYDFLVAKWPVTQGARFITALQACSRVADKETKPEFAREAFVLAALEAGIPVSQVDGVPATSNMY